MNNLESAPKLFEWRSYMQGSEKLSPNVLQQLDELERLINEGGPDVQDFLHAVESGGYLKRTIIVSMIHYFRDILTPEERKELDEAVRATDPKLDFN